MKKCWSEMYQFELTDPVSQANLVLNNLNGKDGVSWGCVLHTSSLEGRGHLLTVLSIPFKYLP